ncbi:MAG: TolC family protein [Bacteroidetes bacterium]|jgi:outer membrane protein TolC|nr:TolC family protein [Bacteroidota bacterium]
MLKNKITNKRSIYFFSFGLICAVACGLSVKAQEATERISIDGAIRIALAHNRQAAIAKLDEKIATANYRQTDAIFLPDVSASYSAYTTNDPLSSFGFKLEQQVISSNDFNPTLLNHPERTSNYNASLTVKQPLVNLDMWYARKGAKLQADMYTYSSERNRQYLVFQVQQACMQLQLAYDVTKVLEQARRTAQEAYRFTNDRYQQGLLQKSDVLNAEVEISNMESDLAKAKSGIANASDNLAMLLGRPAGTVYQITDSLNVSLSGNFNSLVPQQRADLAAMQKSVDAANMMVKSGRMGYLPKLNAFGNFQYNDSRVAGFGANSYFAGIQLSWDIFKGNRTRRQVEIQTLQRDKLAEQFAQQKDQAQLELDKAMRDLSDANIALKQQHLAVEQSADALRILQNRYAQGLVNTTDLLAAQTQLAQRGLALAQAKFSAQIANAYINLLTTITNPQ